MDVPVTVKLLRIGICSPLVGEVIFTICGLISPEGNDDGSIFMAVVVPVNTLERRMIVPKENSSKKKKLDTSDYGY